LAIVWRCLCDDTFSRFGTIRRVTDRQTDGRTDTRHDDSIYRASIASRGKKETYIIAYYKCRT